MPPRGLVSGFFWGETTMKRSVKKSLGVLLFSGAAASLAPSGPATSQPAPAQACATVQVNNVRPGQGHLMVAAYASAETFGKQALAS